MKKDLFNIDHLLGKTKEPEIGKEEEMTPDEKKRILQLALNKIDTLPNTNKNTLSRNKLAIFKKKLTKSLTAAGIVLALLTGTYASASIFHLNDKFAEFFHGQERDLNKQQIYIRNTSELSQTNKQVTLSIDQILGDDYSFYILYHLEGLSKKDITPVIKNADISLNITDYQVDDPIFEKEEDGKFYFIQTVRTDENMSGKEIKFHINKIGYYENQSKTRNTAKASKKEKFIPLTDASFQLSWKLNYKISTKQIPVQKKINIYGGTAILDKISISPLSVTVHLTNINCKKEWKQPNDQLLVKMKNKTVYDSYDTSLVDTYNDFDVITVSFHKFISYDDIESITFAKETISLTK